MKKITKKICSSKNLTVEQMKSSDGTRNDRRKDNKKAAFTLAEVLITLGIIGVVAALTIPTLIRNLSVIKLQSQFKEAYSLLSQAVIQFNEDESNESMTNGAPILMKYFKGATRCTDNDTRTTTFCMTRTEGELGATNKDYEYTDYTKTTSYVKTNYFDDYQFFLPNGMLIINDFNPLGTHRDFYVSVDVNGKKGKPNALGHDFFVFVLRETEKTGGIELIPSGESTTYYGNKNAYCSQTLKNSPVNGAGCTFYAITDSEYFKNLPK